MEKFADIFVRKFRSAYSGACADHASAFSDWREPRKWTGRMLRKEDGVLTTAARAWARECFGDGCFDIFHEHRRIDLMAVRQASSADPWWMKVPVLMIEHENDHDVEIEAWTLSAWRANLKVLVFYYDGDDDLKAKVNTIAGVIRRFAFDHGALDETLLLTAPMSFGEGLVWRYTEWDALNFRTFQSI